MPTLARDIQQLDLSSNSLTSLQESEFLVKKFKNLQKIYMSANQLLRVHPGAFHKLTGLIELDLSENLISDLSSAAAASSSAEEAQAQAEGEAEAEEEEEARSKQMQFVSPRKKKKKKITFLSPLAQLRQLNLASNQLTRLGEFAFSPAKQLRQLYLSR